MSDSAWLVCDTDQVQLGLGKPVRNPDGSVHYFHYGSTNSADSELTRALWKFLAEHGEHGCRVVISGHPDFDTVASYRMIGSDALGDVDFPEYLAGWPG